MKRILVAAAVIRRQGKILIAQRLADKHQGGLWEFPGGKVEEAESVEQALARELVEELGIVPERSRPLIRISHDYPDKSVCLDVWEVSAFRGEPHGREGQPLRWVTPETLAGHAFPEANRPIVSAACLPSLYAISPDQLTLDALLTWADERLEKGIRLMLFRAPSLAREEYCRQAMQLLERCRKAGAELLLHGDPDLLGQVPADGLHLPAREISRYARRPVPADKWLAASVHDKAELLSAESLDANFVTISPVQPTHSHPDAPVLGWNDFARLAEKAVVPVYALGGLGESDLETAWQAGAQGVAGIRGL